MHAVVPAETPSSEAGQNAILLIPNPPVPPPPPWPFSLRITKSLLCNSYIIRDVNTNTKDEAKTVQSGGFARTPGRATSLYAPRSLRVDPDGPVIVIHVNEGESWRDVSTRISTRIWWTSWTWGLKEIWLHRSHEQSGERERVRTWLYRERLSHPGVLENEVRRLKY